MKLETHPNSAKQAEMLRLLQLGTVMVFVDSRQESVKVPEYLKGNPQLRLNFDYQFEIDDFRILPDRLEASLSFDHKDFFCVIPFSTAYLFVCHESEIGALFPESTPTEMLEAFSLTAKSTSEGAQPPQSQPVTAKVPETEAEAPAADDNTPKLQKRHLRVVK